MIRLALSFSGVLFIFSFLGCVSPPSEQTEGSPLPPSPSVYTSSKEAVSTESTESSPQEIKPMKEMFPPVEGTQRMGTDCTTEGEKRFVEVIDTKEGHCGVVYAKQDQKETQAYAKNDMSFCDKVYGNILRNLTRGGFNCGRPPSPQSESTISPSMGSPQGRAQDSSDKLMDSNSAKQ